MREDDVDLFDDEPLNAEGGVKSPKRLPQRSHPVLPRDENRALADRARNGDRQALERVIHHNMRLVYSVASRYVRRGVPFEDLVQEGVIGLMKAISRFDISKDVSLITYATWWIRQAIQRYVLAQGHMIQIPVYLQERISEILRVQVERAEAGLSVSNEEVAQQLGLTTLQVSAALAAFRQRDELISLTDPLLGFTGGQTLSYEDVIPDTTMLPPHLAWAAKSRVQELISAITEVLLWLRQRMGDRNYHILRLRLGLTTERIPMTLEDIGKAFGLTRERVRQIEASAFKQLRQVKHVEEAQFRQWLEQLDDVEDVTGEPIDWDKCFLYQ